MNNETTWKVFNLAEIGRQSEKFSSYEEAMKYVRDYAENEQNPWFEVDYEQQHINFRGKVFL